MDSVTNIYSMNKQKKDDPFIKRDYKNTDVLAISIGYHNKFLNWFPELTGDASILYFRDPYGVLFCKGIDGRGKHEDLENHIKTEIEALKPKKIIFISSCVHGALSMILAFKFQADRAIVFSPWTYICEESANVADSTGGCMVTQLIHNAFKSEILFNPSFEKFAHSFDVNLWKDKIGKTRVFYYYNESAFDADALHHIDDELVKQFTIKKIEGAKHVSDTIKGARSLL